MKHKLTTSFLGIALLLAFQFVNATVEPASTLKPVIKDKTVATIHPLTLRTLEDFLSLTPKKYTELTGKKMTLPQKVSLKIAQHKVKRAIKKGKTVDLNALSKEVDTSNFNIGGFVLGLLLGIIGVLIAYLIGDRNIIKWAWIGFAVWVGIVLLILIL
jgi:hypothetical protein